MIIHKCKRCLYEWYSNLENPQKCARCGSRKYRETVKKEEKGRPRKK